MKNHNYIVLWANLSGMILLTVFVIAAGNAYNNNLQYAGTDKAWKHTFSAIGFYLFAGMLVLSFTGVTVCLYRIYKDLRKQQVNLS